jgi:hypothetical protein
MTEAEVLMHAADTLLLNIVDWFENLVPLIVLGLEG